MFSTLKMRLLLGLYIFLILSIPIGAYLASQTQNIKSKAEQPKKKVVNQTPTPTNSAAKELLNLSQIDSSPTPQPSSTTATSFGPTLSLKAILEGRPLGNQTTKLFVGIAEGQITTSPKFLLSFTVDLPPSGSISGLSLAGLSSGSTYTALLKGASQIATSSAFVMSPNITNLNSGQTLNMLSGDLNEDNVIDALDYSIVQKALGSKNTSATWVENADFNKDKVINSFDLSFVSKNLGKVGASGAWTSPIPKATASAGLTEAIGSTEGPSGYWIWVPRY